MLRCFPLVLALAAALSGCVAVSQESARQLDGVGDVELSTVVCASELGQGPTCPLGNDGRPAGSGEFQLLMAYRIPAASAPPESLVATEGPLALARSQTFTAELNRLAPPADAGQRWVGYLSEPFEFSPQQSSRTATIVARMMLLRGADGSPFAGPFRYRTIVGFRSAQPDSSRPVVCGDALHEDSGDGGRCMDWPAPEEVESHLRLPTRDLGVHSGAVATAAGGGAASLPFSVTYNGSSPSPSFALSATTTVPGATAAPAVPSIAPEQAGTTSVPVAVNVPASTPPGSYEVTLTATHGSGQSRSGTGVVHVRGADPVDRLPPELAVRLRTRPRINRARHAGVVADVSCSEICRLTAQLRAGRQAARGLRLRIPRGARAVVIGGATERRSAPGRRNLRVRFRRGMGPRLLRLRRVTLNLLVTARDPAGNVRRRTIRFALRR